MKKIELSTAPVYRGTGYPPPYDAPCLTRVRQAVGEAGGLTQFGVNVLTLEPGVWSSQRHWHSAEDEFVWVLEGEVTLITDGGEEVLRAGDCAGFPSGEADGHHLVNRSRSAAKVLEIGTRSPEDRCLYPEADMTAEPGEQFYRRRDGTPYPPK